MPPEAAQVATEIQATSTPPPDTQATTQAAPVTTPGSAPAPVAGDEKPDPLHKAMAQHAAAVKRFQEQQKAFKAEREALEKEFSSYREVRELAGKDPVAAMERLGLKYDAVTQAMLSRKKPDAAALAKSEVDPVRAELEQLKAKLAEQEQARATAEQEATKAKLFGDIKTLVTSNGDDYAAIAHSGGENAVFDYIAEHYRATFDPVSGHGEVLPVQQAAHAVEQQMRRGLEKLAPLFHRLFPPTESAPETPKSAAPKPATKQPSSDTRTGSARGDSPRGRTLTNQAASEVASATTSTKPKSLREVERERLRRAAAVIEARFKE